MDLQTIDELEKKEAKNKNKLEDFDIFRSANYKAQKRLLW